MIDLQDLREQPDKYRRGAAAKQMRVDIDGLLGLDEQFRVAFTRVQDLLAEKNRIGKEIGQLAGKLKKAAEADRAVIQSQMVKLQERPNEIKREEQELAASIAEFMTRRDEILLTVPLPPDDDVPVGTSADDNVELRSWKPDWFDPTKSFAENKGFTPKSHIELMQAHGMVDFERGVKMAGSRSYVLLGAGMALHQAVLRYAFDFMTQKHGFAGVSVPVLVREELMEGTGFFPQGREQAYCVPDPEKLDKYIQLCKVRASTGEVIETEFEQLINERNLYLTGTGEVGLMGLHMNEILEAASLPRCYTTVSTCFRREAGAAGKDTAGLYRIHQFDKVEQVVICEADEQTSRDWHRKMIGFVEELLRELQLPYRLLQCCTGDLGPKNADMIDVECWMPSRDAYGETHSASRLYDYQCRRLNLRYKDPKTGKNLFCHSLNNTVLASPRILIPIVELYQNADGTIRVPDALRPHLGGLERLG